jgi:sensor c-di-GMP phosphodiesterase-like protein
MAGSSAAVERLTEVRRQGVPLALDDFGTGFSSLSMLVRLPIDILKIDKSFVQTLGRNRKTSSMTENIVRLGHSLGMEVVAEGIETDAQWEEMKRYGCRRGQGWRFAKALTPEAFVAYVREGSGAKAA